MARGQDSSVAVRVLGPRATVLGTGNGDALQNIGTAELPDGASCYVTDIRVNYRWNPASVAAPSGTDVVAPFGDTSKPGRWFSEQSSGSPAGAFHVMLNFADTEVDGPRIPVTVNEWAVQPDDSSLYADVTPGPASTLWSVDEDTGVITYTGTTGQMFKISAGASVTSVLNPDLLIDMAISQNSALVGTDTSDFTSSQSYVNPNDGDNDDTDQDVHIYTERLFIPDPADTFQAIFRIRTDNGQIRVNRLNLIIIPV